MEFDQRKEQVGIPQNVYYPINS